MLNAGPIGVPTQEKPHPLTGGHLPVVMGHELCGRVETAPSGSDLKAGDAVMVDPHFTCENCRQCKHDQDHLCQKMGFVGASGGNYGGGLSQFVAVDANMVHRLPDTIHVDNAAVVEPLAVAHHCIKTSAANFSSPGTSVLISGGGPIGYAVALTLRAHGARKILLSEPTETRRKYAREIVDIVINPLTESVGEKCRKTTDGAGVDVVFDCAGSKRASEDAFDAIKPGGRFVNVAMWSSFVCTALILIACSIDGALDRSQFRTIHSFGKKYNFTARAATIGRTFGRLWSSSRKVQTASCFSNSAKVRFCR